MRIGLAGGRFLLLGFPETRRQVGGLYWAFRTR